MKGWKIIIQVADITNAISNRPAILLDGACQFSSSFVYMFERSSYILHEGISQSRSVHSSNMPPFSYGKDTWLFKWFANRCAVATVWLVYNGLQLSVFIKVLLTIIHTLNLSHSEQHSNHYCLHRALAVPLHHHGLSWDPDQRRRLDGCLPAATETELELSRGCLGLCDLSTG